MGTLTYSHSLVAGAPENVNHVQDMFNDARTVINGNIDATNIADGSVTATELATAVQQALFAPGDLKITAVPAAPTGWLMCDGAVVSRATYAALFAAIGTTYGAGDGSTTFGIPDLRGRTAVGVDGAAARLDALDALGNAGGEQKHTITSGEMPSHRHRILNLTAGGGATQSNSAVATATSAAYIDATGPGGLPQIEATGGGAASNVMQPYQIINYMIKT
jgi:microcystin-dependent protein